MQVKRVPSNLVVVKVSQRKYRIAKLSSEGNGMAHFNADTWGITGIRQFELLEGTFTLQELHDILAEYCRTEPTEEWKG